MKVNFLQNLSKILSPIISMAIKLGVNYKEFNALSKKVFVNEAGAIISANGDKLTDAAISASTNIARSYIAQNKKQSIHKKQTKQWISLPAQIIAAWITQDLKKVIPYAKQDDANFVDLVKNITTEKSPKTILNELVRLGHARKVGNEIHLTVFEADNNPTDKAVLFQDFSDNLATHAWTGNSILTQGDKTLFEQAVKIDGVFDDSAKMLCESAKEQWQVASKKVIKKATPISEKEEKQGGKHRVVFGVYCYYR
ncbi:hypothetical protein [Candidatus Thiodubiliella endoseptemdiera]|uniref:Uncharacterized protein n=1 Tax=Candidatus Thiodubiliella endoseptemdiera TaxID=2738886 RepID=A0A853F0A5_9GAMM|nr:hypothetical protein [Candidatus Thiodubiliella endoseptemdiera]